MGTVLLTVLGGIFVAAIGAVGTYLAIRYKASGKPARTEADVLWSSSEKYRDDLTERLEKIEAKAEALQAKINDLQEENLKLREELYRTRRAAFELSAEVSSMKSNVQGDVSALRQELSILQGGSV